MQQSLDSRQPQAPAPGSLREITKEQFWKTYKEGTYLPGGDSRVSRGSDTVKAGPSRNLLKN